MSIVHDLRGGVNMEYVFQYEGSWRLSVAVGEFNQFSARWPYGAYDVLTFQVKKYIRPVIFEHLSYELDVHVLYVDLLITVTCIRAIAKWPGRQLGQVLEGSYSTPLLLH